MNKETRDKIVKLTLEQLKKKYVHGENGPETFDCAGLVWHVYKEVMDINVYKNGIGKSTTGRIMTNGKGDLELFDEKSKNKDLDSIKEGDVLFFHRQALKDNEPSEENKYPGHCGIYLGNNKFIHATRITGSVIISDLKDIIDSKKRRPKTWEKVLVGYRNMID